LEIARVFEENGAEVNFPKKETTAGTWKVHEAGFAIFTPPLPLNAG
jgi:hypothetical protein